MGALTLEKATVSDNRAGSAAGIYTTSFGGRYADVRNSTIAGNATFTSGSGGGIFNNSCPLTVWNSTLSGNTASSGGGLPALALPLVPS